MVPRQLVGRRACMLALAALLGTPLAAQERISPEAFLARVTGKTLSFYSQRTGQLVGVEQFLSPRLSVWRGQENTCVYGEITTPDGQICFLYRDLGQVTPTCWAAFDQRGTLLVMNTNRSFGEVQIARADGVDLGCPETPLS